MNRIVFISLILTAGSVMALTPAERKIALKAKSDLAQAISERDAARFELSAAEQSAKDSAITAENTEQRAVTAEKQAEAEHKQLQLSENENAKMRPIIQKVNAYWGLGGILYGIGRLATHVLILVGVLIVLGILLVVFVPAAKPVLTIIASTFAAIWNRILSLVRPKPAPPTPPVPPSPPAHP